MGPPLQRRPTRDPVMALWRSTWPCHQGHGGGIVIRDARRGAKAAPDRGPGHTPAIRAAYGPISDAMIDPATPAASAVRPTLAARDGGIPDQDAGRTPRVLARGTAMVADPMATVAQPATPSLDPVLVDGSRRRVHAVCGSAQRWLGGSRGPLQGAALDHHLAAGWITTKAPRKGHPDGPATRLRAGPRVRGQRRRRLVDRG
jgi:hypothetical protein